MNKKLIHYSCERINSLENRDYDQSEFPWQAKPNGLWLSVGDDWKEWCLNEKFKVEDVSHSHEIILKNDANILFLNSSDELFEFTRKFYLKTRDWDSDYDTYQIRWNEVKSKYQGIIIPEYLWKCRLALESAWYYGWDCASGCIWDLDCIEQFNYIGNEQVKVLCEN